MQIPRLIIALLWCAASAQCVNAQVLTNITTPSLNLTTVTGRNGHSVLECWQFPGFQTSATPGVSGALNLFLADAQSIQYTVIPPRFDGGLHNAPVPQFVFFVSGLAHVTLPNQTEITSTNEAWVEGGKYGLLLALDTVDVSKYGHYSTYPGATDCVIMVVPIDPDYLPTLLNNTRVLYDGPCRWTELVGL